MDTFSPLLTEGVSHEEPLPQPSAQAQVTPSAPSGSSREEKRGMNTDCADEAEDDTQDLSDKKESNPDRNKTDQAESMDN